MRRKSSDNIVEMVEVTNSFNALENLDNDALLSEAVCPQEHPVNDVNLTPSLPDLSEGTNRNNDTVPQLKSAAKPAASISQGKINPSQIPKLSLTGTKKKRLAKNFTGPQQNRGSSMAHSSGK